jgi:glycosyltransferase involved in cell wall biosynthesis
MPEKTILVCEAQVPFVQGGAEYHVRELVRQLKAHGYPTELVSVPFKWYPKEEILAHAAAWRLLDLSESNGRPVDLLIATKFPSYFARHPNKVVWLIHQHRAAYELAGTRFSDFAHTEADVALRDKLIALDTQTLGECQRRFANARNTAERARRYNGVDVEPLYHPPRLAERIVGGPYGDYILSVGRLEAVKRVDLAIRALAQAPGSLRLLIAGTGTQAAAFQALAESLGIADRVVFLGAVDDDTLLSLYAGARAVVFPPFDEDFGYITLEAFLARKAVVTTTDAGGPTEFVVDGENGYIVTPEPEAMAAAFAALDADARLAQQLGEEGHRVASAITWTGVIERLVGATEGA